MGFATIKPVQGVFPFRPRNVEMNDDGTPKKDYKGLEIAIIDGLRYVVRYGQFNEGDYAVVIRPGCKVTKFREYFEFLNPPSKKRPNKIKTLRVKEKTYAGVHSHGVAIPFDDIRKMGLEPTTFISSTQIDAALGIERHLSDTSVYVIRDLDEKIAQLKRKRRAILGNGKMPKKPEKTIKYNPEDYKSQHAEAMARMA